MPDVFPSPAAPSERAGFDWAKFIREQQAQEAQEAPVWTLPEAMFCIFFMAATCDGRIAAEESAELQALMRRSHVLKTLTPEQLCAVDSAVVGRIKADSELALADACSAVPGDLRLPVFAQALDLSMADGGLAPAEADFLNALSDLLELGEDEVRKVAPVILLKNRC